MTLLTGQFNQVKVKLGEQLTRNADLVDVGEWQSQDVSDKPEMVTHELRHVVIQCPIPATADLMQISTGCNMPWAEDHFLERVGGEPLNPPPSEAWWPYARKGNEEHKKGEIFSHSYPERFWPKFANVGETRPNGRQVHVPHNGIRFEYGDLDDVVTQLCESPLTRQAYLPVWFPEDTGAVHGERVPCTLGYHFIIRSGWLDITYFIRSCDFLRHFPDDAYMAMRLAQWMCEQVVDRVNRGEMEDMQVKLKPGDLVMHMVSLHTFAADASLMKKMYGL